MSNEKHATPEVSDKPQTKSKVISLSIGDLIAVVLFAISIGTSIGFYVKTVGDIGEIKKDVKQSTTDIREIEKSSSSLDASVGDIKDRIKRIEDKVLSE